MNTNKMLSMAVMLVLGSATTMQQANATDFSTTSPIKIASETTDVGSSGELYMGTDTFAIPVTTGIVVSSTASYFVQITLTGGAQFVGKSLNSMVLACSYGAAGVKTAMVDAPAISSGGAAASFKLESGTLGTTGCTLSFTGVASTAFLLTSGNKDYGISVLSRSTDPSAPFSNTQAGTLVSFAQGITLSKSGGTVVVNVVTPANSKVFLDKTNDSVYLIGTTTAVANLGRIMYAPDTNVRILSGTSVGYNSFLKTATLIVSGVPVGAAVSATSGSTTVTGGIYLSSTASCTAAFAIDAMTTANIADASVTKPASGNQVSFNIDASAFAGAAVSGIHVCMLPNGITSIDRGTVSYQLTAKTTQTIGTPNLSTVDTVLTTVTKNGASIKVLNIPSPDNATDQAYIRLYNMGTSTGKVMGTLYSQGTNDAANTGGGDVLGTPSVVLVDALDPNGVTVLTAAQLAAKIGVTTWVGRAWLQLEGEVQGLRVQALIRSGGYGGTLVNASDRVKADNEQLCRSEEDECRTPK